jgi:Rhodopirellula transposase DDE domain
MAVAAPAVEIKSDRPVVVPAGLGWLVGDCKNGGRELRRKGEPEPVRVHDFEIKGLGEVSPYGVYDIAANHGWVYPQRRQEALLTLHALFYVIEQLSGYAALSL